MGEFKVWSDTAKNRIYIRIGGFIREAEAKPAIGVLQTELQKMRPDFDVVTDTSKFVPGSPAAVEALRLGAELVRDHGRRRAVRITSGIVTGLMQFKRVMGAVFDEDETVRYAGSLAEADAILDTW